MANKVWRTKKPAQPRVYSVQMNNLHIFRENCSAITQLLAHISCQYNLSSNEKLKEQLSNTVKFLDDMRFLFGKFEQADAIKIEK